MTPEHNRPPRVPSKERGLGEDRDPDWDRDQAQDQDRDWDRDGDRDQDRDVTAAGCSGGPGSPGGPDEPGGLGGSGGRGGTGDLGGSGGSVEDVLAALVDPTRRRLLDALANRGEASATTLATEVPVSRQAVVKHLAALDRAGLVEGHRAGREVRYRLTTDGLSDTAQWMADLAADWGARLATIKHIAESHPKPPPPTDPTPSA